MNLGTATMSGGSGSLQDLPPTSVFESPPSLLHGNGGYQADLINLTLDSPGEPLGGSPPKRTRQAESSPGGLSDSTGLEENVTMEAIARTLQHQLQQERQVLSGEIQRAMSQVNSRVDDIEKVLGDKLGDAVGMLQDLAGVQKKQGEKLETVAAETQDPRESHRRPGVPPTTDRSREEEGAPRGANLLEDDAGNRKPALIIGGWDSWDDQPGDETLTKAQNSTSMRRKRSSPDAEGDMRFFLSMHAEEKHKKRPGEGPCVQSSESGGRMLFWAGEGTAATAAYGSRLASPQRNAKRAQLAAKTKRLILELGGAANRLEVEYSTGTAWYNGGKVCSGTEAGSGVD